MLKELNRHEVVGVKRVIKIVKALSDEVVEATHRGIRMIHHVGREEKKSKEKRREETNGEEEKVMEIDGYIK